MSDAQPEPGLRRILCEQAMSFTLRTVTPMNSLRPYKIKVLEQKGYGRSSWQADLILRYGVVQLRLPPFLGLSIENVRDLPA
jgi:hypothetical protein